MYNIKVNLMGLIISSKMLIMDSLQMINYICIKQGIHSYFY